MARLIIGHVDHQGGRIWLRGTKTKSYGFLAVRQAGTSSWGPRQSLDFEERHDYTGVIELAGLKAWTRYEVRAGFGNSATAEGTDWEVGQFRTMPAQNEHRAFTFILGSCNLHSLGPVSSPDPAFETIARLAKEQDAQFMIHCGDQIYADIPLPPSCDIAHYRAKYKDAWEDSHSTRALLAQLPHYMILDDHEIVNNFANQDKHYGLKDVALKVYREYQDIHNPQTYGIGHLHYRFQHGTTEFFVMDTRSERDEYEMIDPEQMANFLKWLASTKHASVRFIVSSVPFVGEVRNDDDKWCATRYLPQRAQIVDALYDNRGPKTVFLTGDMHNSYKATMSIEDDECLVHELMSSPVNQLGKSKFGKYDANPPTYQTAANRRYTSSLHQDRFFSGHSNVMLIHVDEDYEISYKVYRTKSNQGPVLTGIF